jgi:hypothetical protein
VIGLLLTVATAALQGASRPVEAPKHASPVKIVCDVAEPRIQVKASVVAEATWKETCALFGTVPKATDPPREIHLYGTAAEYEAACDKLVGGNLKRNMAFTAEKPPSVHIVLQPPIRGDAQKTLVPTWQTLRLVAHETSHLARYVTLASYGDHPGWLTDGAAIWIEARVLAAQGLFKRAEQWPFCSTDVVRVQRLVKDAHLPTVDDLVHDRTDALEFYSRYAARGLLFRYLIEGERSKQFRSFLLDLVHVDGGQGCTARVEEMLKAKLDVSDWKELDAGFRKWIADLKPEWDEVFTSLEPVGDDWTQTSFDDSNAIAWRAATVGDKPYAIEGSVTTYVDRADRSQANLLIGRMTLTDGTQRFVSFAFEPGLGVTVFDFDGSLAEDKRWNRKAFVDSRGSEPGKPLAFRVDCVPTKDSTDVKLTLAGKVVAQFSVGRALDGPWGVGAQAGSSCVWHKVKLVAGSPK